MRALAAAAVLGGVVLVATGCGSQDDGASSPATSASASASASESTPSASPSTETPSAEATTEQATPEPTPSAAQTTVPVPAEPSEAPATYQPTQHPQSTRDSGQQAQQGTTEQTPQPQTRQSATSQAGAPAAVEGSEGPVNSGDEAIAVVRKALGNKESYHYGAHQEQDLSYTVQVTDPALQAQGGTGQVGVFTVKPDGTYRMQ